MKFRCLKKVLMINEIGQVARSLTEEFKSTKLFDTRKRRQKQRAPLYGGHILAAVCFFELGLSGRPVPA